MKRVFLNQIVGWCGFSNGKWGRTVSTRKELTEAVGPNGRVGRQLRKNVKKETWVVTQISIKRNQSIRAKDR